MTASSVAEGAGPARQLRAVVLLPAMAVVVVPAALCIVYGTNVGWDLPGIAAAAPALLGVALAALGLRLIHRTISLFSRLGEGTLAPWDPTRKLVVEGPYRRVRNPMITGVFTVLLGETALLGAPEMLVWAGAFALVNAIYMPLFEEPRLVRRFGDDYLSYKRNVPRWIPRRTPWMPTLALALAAAFFVCAQAPAIADETEPPGAGAVAVQALQQSPADVRSYWTPERMRDAEPLDAPGAPAGAGAAAAPNYLVQAPDQVISPERDLAYPERIHGRLFVTFGPDSGSCSATVVTSRARNVILTAGHCVAMPTGEGSPPIPAGNVLFVPGYRNGAAPFGSYVGTALRAPGLWSFEGLIEFDLGAINLAPTPAGQIEDVLGSRGVSFNRSYKKNKTRFQAFGYPGQPTAFYDGERPILCNSPFRGLEKFTLSPQIGPCNMKEGSSGGGWVLSGGLVNSVVSHNGCGISPACSLVSGTYFGDIAFKLWSAAGGGIAKGRKKQIRNCRKKAAGKRIGCLIRAQTFKPTVR